MKKPNSDRNTFCLTKTNIFCMVKIHRNFVGLASVSVGKKFNSARNPIFGKNVTTQP